MAEKPIHVVAEVVSTPGSAELVWDGLQKLSQLTRKEPGNIAYGVMQDNGKMEHYLVYEIWSSKQDFDRHVTSAHFAEFDRTVRSLLGEPMRIVLSTLRS